MSKTTLCVFALGYILAPFCQAQNRSEASGIAGLAHVAIRVSDVDREVAFFGKMGFEEAFANSKDGHVTEAYIKVNDRQFIEILPTGGPGKPAGFMDVGFESADLNALNARYIAAGLNAGAVRKGGAGNLIFMLPDADDRDVVFTQYLPGSLQMNDKGQHLGIGRVSEQLLGLDLPVKDVMGAQKFYEMLGFYAEGDGVGVHLSIPADPELWIELHEAGGKDPVHFLFTIADAHRVADELHMAGIKYDRHDKVVFVSDPDGNSFVLMEPVGDSKHRGGTPWRHN